MLNTFLENADAKILQNRCQVQVKSVPVYPIMEA